MNFLFDNENFLKIILAYLDIKSILFLSLCKKEINKKLSPVNNEYVNILFFLKIMNDFYDFDKIYNKCKKNLFGKNLKFNIDCKYYYNQIYLNYSLCKEEKIRKKIIDFFRIHIYLSDLRKEIFILEYHNSTTHMMKCYDYNINLIHTYNYYSKYITPEFVLNTKENKGKIEVLREKLIFEDYLINFKTLFYDFINNKSYVRFINNVCEYNIDTLEEIYKSKDQTKTNFHTNEQNSNIIQFIVWICHSFILYAIINFEYINSLSTNDKTDDEELLSEYINKKNDLNNCGLLINSHFENINIIVNLLSIYNKIYDSYSAKYLKSKEAFKFFEPEFRLDKSDSDNYKSKIIYSKKFTLNHLFLKIIDKYFTNKLSHINIKFPCVTKKYFKLSLNPENKEKLLINKNKMDIDEDSAKKDNNKELNSIKNLIENYINCQLDNYVNEKNANGINHTHFKVNECYIKNIEDVLIKSFEDEIENCFKEKISIDIIFGNVEKITRCEGNSKNSYPNKESLNVIRRTKFRLMKKGYTIVFNHLMEEIVNDFKAHIKVDETNGKKFIYLSAMERLNMKEYRIILDVLTKDGKENVNKNIKDEYERTIEYLKKNLDLNDSETYLAMEYINCSKIEYVFFFNKLLWNYYKQLEIYKERDDRIVYFIKNNKDKFLDKNDYKNAVYIRDEKKPLEEENHREDQLIK